MKKYWVLSILFILVVFTATAQGDSIIFQDTFNSENGGVGQLNYNNFLNWTITGGTVDLIGNGFFDFPPVTNGHGLYVDLDGSTFSAGLMTQHPIHIGPGIYDFTFELAGNQRNAGNEIVDVSVAFNSTPFMFGSFVVPDTQPFVTYVAKFGSAAPGDVTIAFHNRGSDNIGALLDNITLTQVPEPATVFLFVTGLGAVLSRRRRR